MQTTTGQQLSERDLQELFKRGFVFSCDDSGVLTILSPGAAGAMMGTTANTEREEKREKLREEKKKRQKEQRRAATAPYVSKRGESRVGMISARCEPLADTKPRRESDFRCDGCGLCRDLDDANASKGIVDRYLAMNPNVVRFSRCPRLRYVVYVRAAANIASNYERVEKTLIEAGKDRNGLIYGLQDHRKTMDPVTLAWERFISGMFNNRNIDGKKLRGDTESQRFSRRFRFVERWCRSTGRQHGAQL